MKVVPSAIFVPKPYQPPLGNLVFGSAVVLTYHENKKSHIVAFEFSTVKPIKLTTDTGELFTIQFPKTDVYVAETSECGQGWHSEYFYGHGYPAYRDNMHLYLYKPVVVAEDAWKEFSQAKRLKTLRLIVLEYFLKEQLQEQLGTNNLQWISDEKKREDILIEQVPKYFKSFARENKKKKDQQTKKHLNMIRWRNSEG